MEANRAIAILKTLANGVDTQTGAIFPWIVRPYQDAEIARDRHPQQRRAEEPCADEYWEAGGCRGTSAVRA